MEFIWDQHKAKTNIKKHNVSFEEAKSVFYDPLAKIATDPDHSISEERMILIGYSYKDRLLIVIHLHLESTNTIRIISARAATKKEQKDFEEIL
jgi:uncharacterized DUF497 family protein